MSFETPPIPPTKKRMEEEKNYSFYKRAKEKAEIGKRIQRGY